MALNTINLNLHYISGLEDLYIGLPRCELYRTARFELVNVYAYVYKILFTPSMWDRLWIFLRYPNGIANKGTKVLKEAVSRFKKSICFVGLNMLDWMN